MIDFSRMSFIILAGGDSRRMGSDKAALCWRGKSFLQHQVEKARLLGCQDILISGGTAQPKGTRRIQDVYAGRGPLGGIYSCLLQAHYSACLVVSVDVPGLSAEELVRLAETLQRSGADAALLQTEHGMEPLIGVYRTNLAKKIEPLLQDGAPGVYRLLKEIETVTVSCEVPVVNCNTPEDLEVLKMTAQGELHDC